MFDEKSREKTLKEIIKKHAEISRQNNIFDTTTECFECLEKCKKCHDYEPRCKIKIDAYIRELKNNYY